MNRYQKIVVIVIRCGAVALFLQSIGAVLVHRFMLDAVWTLSIFSVLPNLVGGVVLFILALPLARLITWGIEDE
mgnify:CR=1 FL=1